MRHVKRSLIPHPHRHRRYTRLFTAALLLTCAGGLGCGAPRLGGLPVHPSDTHAPRDLYRIVLAEPIAEPDNFVLRPDEFAAVTVDHARGLIYAGSRQGSLVALDERSGEIRWEMDLGGAVSSVPVLTEVGLQVAPVARASEPSGQAATPDAVASSNEETSASPEAGASVSGDAPRTSASPVPSEAQSASPPPEPASAAVAKPATAVASEPVPLLLVGTDNGELIAIDPDKRSIVWRYATSGKIRRAPVVHEGVVYLVNSRDQVFALDLRSGAWRWQYEQDFQTDFTVNGRAGLTFVPDQGAAAGEPGVLYTGFANGKVVALGAGTGEALWVATVAPPSGGNFIDADTTPLYDPARGVIYVAGHETGVFALAVEDGKERWQFPARGVGSLALAPTGDLIAASSLEGLMAVDRNGALIWRTQVDPGTLAEPVIVNNTVFVTHSDQGLLAFDLDSGALLNRLDLGSGMSSVPTFDATTGRFYATTNRGMLVVLELLPSVLGVAS